MSGVTVSPPRAPPIKYAAPLGTRWAKEKAAAGGSSAFDLPTDPKAIGPWILGECVGKGASGRVKIAKHRRTGQLAAVKILPVAPLVNSRNTLSTKQARSDRQRLGIDREITMMKLMNHPNIMRIYDVFEGDKELFLVLEYVEGGELFDFLVNRGRLPPQEALEYFKQIIYGLNYAHTFSIIHRDLKPENILIASLSPPIIKIADWGMAAFAPPSLQLETSCGSPHYASPEIVNGEKYQGNATDIWSCGVILYALLTGRLPFDDKNVRTLLAKVKSGKYDMPAWIDPLAKDLLSRMLVVDVGKRITIPEILSHPWLLTTPTGSRQMNGKLAVRFAPPLPPSPSTLARPIESPSLIDPELFSSLRIIWGRHADPQGESIKRDLCSPAGQGVHAKAFYFLLNKYREDSHLKRLNDGGNTGQDVEYNGISTLLFDRGWGHGSLGIAVIKSCQDNVTEPIASPPLRSRAPATSAQPLVTHIPRRLTAPPPVMDRPGNKSVSKERPVSPAGPRPLPSPQQSPCKVAEHHQLHRHSNTDPVAPVRPISTICVSSRTCVPGPRCQPPRRGYTFSHAGDKKSSRGNNSPMLPPRECRQKPDSQLHSATGILPPHTPVLRQDKVATQGLRVNLNKALNVSPRALITTAQCTQPSITNVNDAINAATHTSIKTAVVDTSVAPAMHISGYARVPRHSNDRKDHEQRKASNCPHNAYEEDKENRSLNSEDVSAVSVAKRTSGVGLGMGLSNVRDMGQEMGNVVYIGTGNTPAAKGKKERKSRPPALNLPAKRPTSSALGSPIAVLSPVTSPQSVGSPTRLLTSPVVGEFKGWFSNLFNWKNGGNHVNLHRQNDDMVYSLDDLPKTCGDVGRLLESLGIIVVFEATMGLSDGLDHNGCSTAAKLKCRVEEPSADAQANLSLKPVRFRVEIKPIGQAKPQVRQSLWSPPLSPIADNSCFFLPPGPVEDGNNGDVYSTTIPFIAAPNPGLTPRVRNSMLPVMMQASNSGQNTPIPSPYLTDAQMNPSTGLGGNSAGSYIPQGSTCAMLLVYEKGSMSSFKAIRRKIKELYWVSPTKAAALKPVEAYTAFSPMTMSTPVVQACPTGQFTIAGC
ncbi:hypothetical protein AX17_002552 [Amanita inopinata Kibby_2008]|nr:hypothetical protein AX17_002552 [Amanita inopinata Kibby_2008]